MNKTGLKVLLLLAAFGLCVFLMTACERTPYIYDGNTDYVSCNSAHRVIDARIKQGWTLTHTIGDCNWNTAVTLVWEKAE